MQRQRRQRELIHHVRLIALTEITDVFVMRNVGFGNQPRAGDHFIQNRAPHFDDVVRLWQVNTGGSGFLPDWQ